MKYNKYSFTFTTYGMAPYINDSKHDTYTTRAQSTHTYTRTQAMLTHTYTHAHTRTDCTFHTHILLAFHAYTHACTHDMLVGTHARTHINTSYMYRHKHTTYTALHGAHCPIHIHTRPGYASGPSYALAILELCVGLHFVCRNSNHHLSHRFMVKSLPISLFFFLQFPPIVCPIASRFSRFLT